MLKNHKIYTLFSIFFVILHGKRARNERYSLTSFSNLTEVELAKLE